MEKSKIISSIIMTKKQNANFLKSYAKWDIAGKAKVD
jgi:hypothetical protein